jgi:hypothetical protein
MPLRRRKASPCASVPGGPDPGEKDHPGQERFWPLPDIERTLPPQRGPGSFWEDRGDRHHAGVDLYAPPGSRVISIEDGTVISAGVFTSPELASYWNATCQVTIAHVSGIFCRYAELGDLAVDAGAEIRGGTVIGHVGEVLNLPRMGGDAPPYVLALRDRGHGSMLHLELFSSAPRPSLEYRGGNWFSPNRPAHLLDPALILRDML